MTKQQILDEIRRTAKQNGGAPLGHKRFEQETGIRHADWWGKHWGRWGDAVTEAGLSPNTLQDAFSDDVLLEKLIAFIRELGRFPGNGDLRLKKRKDPAFPNDKVFDAHFGSRAQLRASVVNCCRSHPGHDDVPTLCGPVNSDGDAESRTEEKPSTEVVGFVYLMKHGKHHKIGKTNALDDENTNLRYNFRKNYERSMSSRPTILTASKSTGTRGLHLKGETVNGSSLSLPTCKHSNAGSSCDPCHL